MQELSPYMKWAMDATPPGLQEIAGTELVRSTWASWFENLAREHRSEAFGSSFAEHCPCPGASAEDYLLREVNTGEKDRFLVGIHKSHSFFVNVYAQSKSIATEEIEAVTRQLMDEYSLFQPMGVRWWRPSHERQAVPNLRILEDSRLIAARISDLELVPQANDDVLRQVHLPDQAFYQAYLKIYERFFETHASMNDYLDVEPLETLEHCAEQGALFGYYDNDRLVGVLAAAVQATAPVSGWCMVEQVLDESMRGRGLAATAQRTLLSRLDVNQSDLIYGTIYAVNEASVRTALRVGRKDWGGWVLYGS